MEPFDPGMSLSRPYLIRAIYQWVVDNGLTPYIVVDCTEDFIDIPEQFIHDGQVILNISPNAVQNLEITDQSIFFNARFAGVPRQLAISVLTVLAIYAKENGQGLIFSNDHLPPDIKQKAQPEVKNKPKKPTLKVVK